MNVYKGKRQQEPPDLPQEMVFNSYRYDPIFLLQEDLGPDLPKK
jgi:hypothetical protein